MKIWTPTDAAKRAGNKYLGVLVAAKFSRYINELPRDRIANRQEKLTTIAMDSLSKGDLNYKISRRRRSEA
jgi:DNA-directed RNA polymerase subunit K/omega